jgi:nucleoside 2-deoxyribosyltransferase
MSLNDSDKCPICHMNFESADRIPRVDAYAVKCQRCGSYEISGRMQIEFAHPEHPEMLPYLSAYTRQSFEFEGRIARLESNWLDSAQVHKHTSIRQRLNKLLRFIERRTTDFGSWVVLNFDLDYPVVDGSDRNALPYLIKHAVTSGYLEDANPMAPNHVQLTVKGWDYLDPGSGGAGIAGRVFVAMSFHESLNEMYERGIKKAIEEDCHMSTIRLDKIHHNEKICDKILAEIRRAQFVVADFTGQNQGVYFEAGFAMALGREVIRTCRQDDVKLLHFDTRQYPHVLWKDPADLRQKLTEFIIARFGVGSGANG